MLDKEIQKLIRLLGPDDKRVKALAWWALTKPEKQDEVKQMLRQLAIERGWDPNDLPSFFLPYGIAPSDYPVGVAVSRPVTGEPVGLTEEELMSHVGVFGPTGRGKTSLIKLLIVAFMAFGRSLSGQKRRFFIWDAHGEYRDLIKLYEPGAVLWLTPGRIGINPLEPPRDSGGNLLVSPEQWIAHLREWLRLWWLNEPSLNLFAEVLLAEYETRGILSGTGGAYPSLSELIKAIERLHVKRNTDRARAQGKLLDRLTAMRVMLPGLDVQQSRDLSRLFRNHSVILDVEKWSDIGFQALFALVRILVREVLHLEKGDDIWRLEVVEEAHQSLGGHVDRRTADLKEGEASGTLRDLRKAGTCGIVASQLAQDVAKSILGNLGTVFFLRQGPKDCVDAATSALNLEPWQRPEMGKLPDRHAVARFARYGEPVCLQVNDTEPVLGDVPDLTREQARAVSEPFLDAIPFVGNGATKTACADKDDAPAERTDELPPDEAKVFACIAERPDELTPDRLEKTGLDKDRESRARSKLMARGLIEFAGKVGAKYRVFQLTARGKEVAGKLGMSVGSTGKGGAAHATIVRYVERSMQRHASGRGMQPFLFYRANTAITIDGGQLQPDLVAIRPDGGRLLLQACARNQPSYEAEVLVKFHRLAWLPADHPDCIIGAVAVAASKGHARAIERAVERLNGGRIPGRTAILDFDTVIAPDFDWSDYLGLEVS